MRTPSSQYSRPWAPWLSFRATVSASAFLRLWGKEHFLGQRVLCSTGAVIFSTGPVRCSGALCCRSPPTHGVPFNRGRGEATKKAKTASVSRRCPTRRVPCRLVSGQDAPKHGARERPRSWVQNKEPRKPAPAASRCGARLPGSSCPE